MKKSERCESPGSAGTGQLLNTERAKGFFPRPLAVALFLVALLPALTAQTGSSPSAAIHDHLQKAEGYLKASDPDGAVKELHAVLALDPKNAEAYANLGVIAFFQRDYQTASRNFRKALAINPSLAKTEALLAVSERRLGNSSARALLEKSFAKLKDAKLRLQVGLELAGLYLQQGDLSATVPVMQSLVALAPDNVDVLFMAQRVYSELADDTLNKLAVLAPGSARMQEAIAQHLVNEGDLKAAIEHYKKALEIEPRLPGARFELAEAILLLFRGDPALQAEAEKELNTVIATEGDDARVQSVLGQIAFDRSDLEGARAHFDRALTLDPLYTEAQIGLGRILMAMGKPQEARKYLETAVRADPLNGSAHYQLAQACRKLQLTDEAKKEFQLFQEIKKTRDQVEQLYHQMNRQSRPRAGEVPDTEQQ